MKASTKFHKKIILTKKHNVNDEIKNVQEKTIKNHGEKYREAITHNVESSEISTARMIGWEMTIKILNLLHWDLKEELMQKIKDRAWLMRKEWRWAIAKISDHKRGDWRGREEIEGEERKLKRKSKWKLLACLV